MPIPSRITIHLSTAFAVAAAEAAADELLSVCEPWSTVVSPTAYTRLALFWMHRPRTVMSR